jgi:hypothetical protein
MECPSVCFSVRRGNKKRKEKKQGGERRGLTIVAADSLKAFSSRWFPKFVEAQISTGQERARIS